MESHFDEWAETCPVQSEQHSYILICIFTNQSEQLHNDQSKYIILTNQDSAIWANRTVQIWVSHLHRNGPPIRDLGRNCLYKSGTSLCLSGKHFVSSGGCVSPFANCLPQSFSFYYAHRTGDSCCN